MIIKGQSRGNARQLADYLMKQGENDLAPEVFEIYGTAQPNDLKKSVILMGALGELSKGEKTLYHAQIAPEKAESHSMTNDQWKRSIRVLGSSLGLDGQPFVAVKHKKEDKWHLHVVYQRYDVEKKRLRMDSMNFKKHDEARAEMETEFNHARTPQKNLNRPQVQRDAMEAWCKTRTGKEFIAALK